MEKGNVLPSSSSAFSQSSAFLYSTNAYFSPSSDLGGGMSSLTSSPYLWRVSLGWRARGEERLRQNRRRRMEEVEWSRQESWRRSGVEPFRG